MELGGKELPRLSANALILGTPPIMPLLPQVPGDADSSDFYGIRVSLKLLLNLYYCLCVYVYFS